MKSKIACFTLSATMLFALPLTLAAAGLNPGLYEYSIKMKMAGMPDMPAQTTQRCLTPKEVEGNKSFEMPQDTGADCKVSGHTQSGNQFSYTVACTKPQKVDGAVKGSYTPTSLTMDMNMTMAGAPGPMVQSITARRLGDCKS
jgi:hypothetical protein